MAIDTGSIHIAQAQLTNTAPTTPGLKGRF
jgi:hypothetical protein